MDTSALQLVAHRGIPARYPENSLLGIEAAMQSGIPFVEFDIQSTGDGELVLSHDIELLRTSGREISLFDISAAHLQSIDIGLERRFGDRFRGTRIPRLATLVALAQKHPQCHLLVELKSETAEHFGVNWLLGKVLHQLQPILKRCTLISFHIPSLIQLRKQGAPCPLGMVLKDYGSKELELARKLEPELMIIDHKRLQPDTLRWPGPWQWMVYSINDPALARVYAASGIALVETDDAIRLRQALSAPPQR